MEKYLITLLITMLLISCETDSDIDYSTEPLTLISDHDLNITDPSGLTLDVSGIFYVSGNREFWIVSDESRKIVVTDFELNPIRSYELKKGKFDGIAVDSQIGRVYLANDEENKLYVYTYQ